MQGISSLTKISTEKLGEYLVQFSSEIDVAARRQTKQRNNMQQMHFYFWFTKINYRKTWTFVNVSTAFQLKRGRLDLPRNER